MKLLDTKYIHFIGIGGIGVSSLAQILLEKGKVISGSDLVPSTLTKNLIRKGIKIAFKHQPSNIIKKHQLVIYSPAIPLDNPELTRAKELKIKCLTYPEALGQLTKEYYTIAIAGTHGKSTITAMISLIATKAGLDPTVVVGTKIREFKNKNYRMGESNYLIIEACEYKDSFLNFQPNVLVITNVEADHLDYFKNLANYKKSFNELAMKVPRDGAIIINGDLKASLDVIKGVKAKVYQLSSQKKNQDFFLKGNELTANSSVKEMDKKSVQKLVLQPKVLGKFNVHNGALAAVACQLLNIPNKIIEQTIKEFSGTWRRLEMKSTSLKGTIVIDDYAHHPTEIQTTLKAIRDNYPKAKILCVFQPHQHNRTHQFLKDFGKSFGSVNQVIVPDIYKVRDSEFDVKSVTTDDLVNEIKKHNKNASNGNGLKATAEYLKKNHKKFDVIVTMGAGDIENIYKEL